MKFARKLIKYILPNRGVRCVQILKQKEKIVEMDCINCSSTEYNLIYPEYLIVRCKKCGLIYSRNRKSSEELKEYYSADYREFAKASNYDDVGVPKEAVDALLKNGDRTFFLNIAKKHEGLLKEQICPHLEEAHSKNFIEVGCAWGGCLLAAQNLGFSATGFEISRPNCELAAKLGLDARNEEFSQADIPGASASVVLFSHSFEHILTPNEYLQKAYDVLEKGGILFLAVPNFNCYWHYRTGRAWMWLDSIAHVAQYTGDILCNMVRQAGFAIKKCFTVCDVNNVLDFVLEEIDTNGKHLTEADAEMFIKKLNSLGMGENLIVIAEKV